MNTDSKQIQEVRTITVGSASKYSVSAKIDGVLIYIISGRYRNYIIVVSLIDGKVWDSIKPLKDKKCINPVTT